MKAQLAILFWDPVTLDADGNLVSGASFVRILEELRRQVPILLLCGGKDAVMEARNIRIVPVGLVPSFASFVLHPFNFVRRIRNALQAEIAPLPAATPVWLVDANLPNRISLGGLKGRKACLYVRGDDAREARVRHHGLAWLAGFAHSLFLLRVRRELLARLPRCRRG